MEEELDLEKSIFADLLCPISHYILLDPVVAEDGITYEREEILKWFASHSTSPMTRETISKTIRNNQLIKTLISNLLQKNPEYKQYQHEVMLTFDNIFSNKTYDNLLRMGYFTTENLLKMLSQPYDIAIEKYILHMFQTFKCAISLSNSVLLGNNICKYESVLEYIINNNVCITFTVSSSTAGNLSNIIINYGTENQIIYYFKANKDSKTFIADFDKYSNSVYISNIMVCIKKGYLTAIKYLITELNYNLAKVKLDQVIFDLILSKK